jgi:hypothetical protein
MGSPPQSFTFDLVALRYDNILAGWPLAAVNQLHWQARLDLLLSGVSPLETSGYRASYSRND